MFSTLPSVVLSLSVGSGDGERSPAPRSPGLHRTAPGGAVPVSFSPGVEDLAAEVMRHLDAGVPAMSEVFGVEPPELRAVVVADADWNDAPRESERPYPRGLPYFTRSTEPPSLVLPETLSPAIRPRTGATLPLAVWHELAHAFLLKDPVVKTPAWLREFVPQTASAAVARREGVPLEEHLEKAERPGFRVREFDGPATAEEQMSFQNLLLALGASALDAFGEAFLTRLVHGIRAEEEIVGEERATAMLAEALGESGEAWLEGREEF